MVYPNEYIPSNEGSRDIIDGNDFPVPFVISLIQQGSSDYLQPNFPTPGQIHSMFNTNKIGECPEYAASPSTMSDPAEWRPNTQLDMIEERLLRIQQWTENTLQRQTRNTVTITDLDSSNENSTMNMVHNRELDFNVEQTVYDISESIRVNLCGEDFETHSEIENVFSNETLKSDEQGSNKREYDVEEYAEQMNSNEIMNNSRSDILNEDYYGYERDEISSNDGISRETYARIKQLEKIFKVNINENDNSFVKELKITLTGKIRDYITQKVYHSLCPINEVIEEVAAVLNEAINHNDCAICDNVHDLCLKLKDIFTLKEEIMGAALKEYMSEEPYQVQAERETDTVTPDGSSYSGSSTKENDRYDVNLSAQQSEEQFKEERLNGTIKLGNAELLNDIESSNIEDQYENKDLDTFESLITFSRIPVANQSKFQSCSSYGNSLNDNRNLKSQISTKIPTYHPTIKNEFNIKTQNNESVQHVLDNKQPLQSHLNKQLFIGSGSSKLKQVKDVSQQKEELVRKATLLGLIDDEYNISRVPHLTERAQLALLERQIQGRIKCRQLASERKRTGLPERVNNRFPNANSFSKINNFDSQKVIPQMGPTVSTISNVEENEILQNNEIIKSSKPNIINKTWTDDSLTDITKVSEQSLHIHGISSCDEISNLPMEEDIESSDSLDTLSNDKKIIDVPDVEDEKITKISHNLEQASEKNSPIFTSFIASKEKLVKWDDENITPVDSLVRVSVDRKKSRRLIILSVISILFAIASLALCHYQPRLCKVYFQIFSDCMENIQQINWKATIKRLIER